MEFANKGPRPYPPASDPNLPQIRRAQPRDATAIYHLLNTAFYTHQHVDWHLPGDWLGYPGFVVFDDGSAELRACLAATADPAPAAWVRLAAVNSPKRPLTYLAPMLETACERLQAEGITELAWISYDRWPDRHMEALHFAEMTYLEGFIKDGLDLPEQPSTAVQIRSALPEDMRQLAAIEAITYDPLWRHSTRGLIFASRQAISFDVALDGTRPIGFQHSTANHENGAHLARITVHPDYQGRGIGRALLTHAIKGYRQRGYDHVTLNTQTENEGARQLYMRLGFIPTDFRRPVWRRVLHPENSVPDQKEET